MHQRYSLTQIIKKISRFLRGHSWAWRFAFRESDSRWYCSPMEHYPAGPPQATRSMSNMALRPAATFRVTPSRRRPRPVIWRRNQAFFAEPSRSDPMLKVFISSISAVEKDVRFSWRVSSAFVASRA